MESESKFSVALIWLYWISAVSKYVPGVFYWDGFFDAFIQIPLYRLFAVSCSVYLGVFSAILDGEYWYPAQKKIRDPPKLLRDKVYHEVLDIDDIRTLGLPKKNWFLVGRLYPGAKGPLSANWKIGMDSSIEYKNWSDWNDDPWVENGFAQFEPIGLAGTVAMIFCMSGVIFIGAYEGVIGWTIVLSMYAFFYPGMSDLLWHCVIGTLIGAAREGKFNQFRTWWYRSRLILSVLSLFVMFLCPFTPILSLIINKDKLNNSLDIFSIINVIVIWLCPGCSAVRRMVLLISTSCVFFAFHQFRGSVLDLIQLA